VCKHGPKGVVRPRVALSCFVTKGSTKVLRRTKGGDGPGMGLDHGVVFAGSTGAARHVCRVTAANGPVSEAGAEDDGANGDLPSGKNSDDDLLNMMQSVSGTLQRKLESMRVQLDDAVEARNALEMELEKEREHAKAQVEQAIQDTSKTMSEEIERLKSELSTTKSSLSAELEASKLEASNTKEFLEEQLSATKVELESYQEACADLNTDLTKFKKHYDTVAVSAALEAEKRVTTQLKEESAGRVKGLKKDLKETRAAMEAAKAEVAEAWAQAELRVAEEVAASVESATHETELTAQEAAMMAAAATKRADWVQSKLIHQGQLVNSVQSAHEQRTAALETLLDAQQSIEALNLEMLTLQERMSSAEARAAESDARAATAERSVEERVRLQVSKAEQALAAAVRDRDLAVRGFEEGKEAAAATIHALTLRAEAAENQLQWQAELLERTGAAEGAREAAQSEAQAAHAEVVACREEIAQLRAEHAAARQEATKVGSELATLQAVLESRSQEMLVRIKESEDRAAELTVAMEEDQYKHTKQSNAAVKAAKISLEVAEKKRLLSAERMERNVVALRTALARSANSLRAWRAEAGAADERAAYLEARLASLPAAPAAAPGLKNNIVPKAKGGARGRVEPVPLAEAYANHKLAPAAADHSGRIANNLNGMELRRVLARGPRVEEGAVEVAHECEEEVVAGLTEEHRQGLYTREALDFRTACGILLHGPNEHHGPTDHHEHH